MKFVSKVILTVLLGLTPAVAFAQNDAPPKLMPTDLGDGIYVLSGGGGNVGVFAGDDGVLVIDDSFAPIAPQIQEFAQQVAGQPVRFVLNTHWHGDHTGGNVVVGEAGALILSQDNVRTRLMTDQTFLPPMGAGTSPALPKVGWPVVTYSNDVTFHMNGQDVHAFYAPAAHTDGDTIVQFEGSNIFHMGDVLLSLGFPIIDHGTGGTLAGVLAANEKVYEMSDSDTRFIAGHGPVVGRDYIGRYVEMLRRVQEILMPMIEAGMSADDIVAKEPLAELRDDWNGGFVKEERMIRQVVGAGR